jgi:phosphohistidine phosphatase SixA
MPIWLASRVLEASFVEGTQLFVELIDFDDAITTRLSGEDIIGTSVVQWSQAVAAGEEIETEVKYSARVKTLPQEPCKVRLRVLTPPADPSEPDNSPFVRWVFLIRHGESAWNKAEQDWSFHKMLNRNHPLSKKGVQQAEEVAALIAMAVVQGERDVTRLAGDNGAARVAYARQEKALPTHDAYNALAGIGRIYASPLTRATQTALVTLQHHPKLASHGLTLRSNLREVKNWFGLDTTGTSRGYDIKQRVEKETSDIVGPLKKNYSMKLCSPKIDSGDAGYLVE